MRIFTMGKITVVCRWESTRSGFRHLATLLVNGCERATAKCCYLNRTWEYYQFESVLKKIINNATCLTKSQKTRFIKKYPMRS